MRFVQFEIWALQKGHCTTLTWFTQEKDLGVMISSSCNPSRQVGIAAMRGNLVLGQLLRAFTNRIITPSWRFISNMCVYIWSTVSKHGHHGLSKTLTCSKMFSKGLYRQCLDCQVCMSRNSKPSRCNLFKTPYQGRCDSDFQVTQRKWQYWHK